MDQKEILYFGDPMCSWCWGFSTTIKRIDQYYGDEAPVSIVLGGLHAYDRDPMSDEYKATIKNHWEDVHKATGAPFDYSFFDRKGFVLDAEPACRAVVTVRSMGGTDLLEFYESISRSFYTENKDTTDVETFKVLVKEVGLDPEAFQEHFESDILKQATLNDFRYSQGLGVTGFPTVVVKEGDGEDAKLALLSAGYQTYENFEPIIEDWLENGLREKSE